MIENPVNADDTRMKLEEAFGIAIESAMVAPQFENSPETILKLQTILHRINLNSDKGHSTKELSKKIFFV
jgi:hypothetical protein